MIPIPLWPCRRLTEAVRDAILHRQDVLALARANRRAERRIERGCERCLSSRIVAHGESLFGLALDQAIAGHGVMLANHPIAMDRLKSGILVRPFGERYVLASPMTYDLLVPATGDAPPAVGRFIDWLLAEAAAFDRETLGGKAD